MKLEVIFADINRAHSSFAMIQELLLAMCLDNTIAEKLSGIKIGFFRLPTSPR